MDRITREALRTEIWIVLTVLRPHQKRPLGIDVERIRGEVTDLLVDRILGQPDSEAVLVRPSIVGGVHATRRGRWGEDEPHPFPSLTAADH